MPTSSRYSDSILIAGGQEDVNIQRLLQIAKDSSTPHQPLIVGDRSHPRIAWSYADDELHLNGELIQPKGIFVRYDVFGPMKDTRPQVATRAMTWYSTITGWAHAHPDVRYPNRNATQAMSNKPAILALARSLGVRIPSTVIGNDAVGMKRLAETGDWILKPTDGGDYCRLLSDTLAGSAVRGGALAQPAIVQSKMIQPEVRIYRVGEAFMAFDMISESLDYRIRQDAEVRLRDTQDLQIEIDALRTLMDHLGMDYGAADFKTDPHDGKLCFLEVNSSPMFAHFDYVANGGLSRLILDHLTGQAPSRGN